MSNGAGIKWRFLIIEDRPEIAQQLAETCPEFVVPDAAEVEICSKFKDAEPLLDSHRYDLLIIDLKDDSSNLPENENLPGLKIYEAVKKLRFVPVVFYTALPKHVLPEQTAFVRVVEKTAGLEKLGAEVRRVMDTKLPALNRHIEDEQRKYMWEFVSTHWKEFQQPAEQADIAYLLARRLAISMEATAIKLAVKVGGEIQAPAEINKAHPMVMYVVPPVGPHPLAGDIVSEMVNGKEQYWIILTPSCDFAQSKANYVILARCERLEDRDEYKKWLEKKDDSSTQRLELLIEDRRGDRLKFLPRVFFIPDLVVDFQQLRSLTIESLKSFKQVATLDSPFAESVMARFSRYFNRLGTPDVDKTVVMNRLQASTAGNPSS